MPDAGTMPDAGMMPDGGTTPDAPPMPDAGPTCGMAPTGSWRGSARLQWDASSGFEYVQAEITWTLASTEGCVDTYRPAGIVRHGWDDSGGQHEDQATVSPGDGTLVIDRTQAVATYTLTGATAPARPWANGQRGSFDGDVFAGLLVGPQPWPRWSFARVDAVFPPPGDGCSEPASDRWHSTTVRTERFSSAETTWTRVSTTGCVDTFTPSGTAYAHPRDFATVDYVFVPDHGAIEADDATLVIDRSTAPPTFDLGLSYTMWPAEQRSTYPDGTVTTEPTVASSAWADNFTGPFDGDHFSARLADDDTGWTFTRGK
ncbi:MAG: hypothetical protein K8M05_03205 [Deltaproteobacteria bacterium]|nr:hypothetical protein [Kofleriaceae bacterium]